MIQTSENNPFVKKIADRVELTLNEIPEAELMERLEKISEKLGCTVEIKRKAEDSPLKLV